MPNHTASHSTFDEQSKFNNAFKPADWLKFCKDFQMPLTRAEQQDVARRKATRNGNQPIDFELFQELLKELFFQKEILEHIINIKEDAKRMAKSALLHIRTDVNAKNKEAETMKKK